MDAALRDILFIDIETIRCAKTYHELDERLKTQWARKASFLRRNPEEEDEKLFEARAGIYAEFGQVITIGMGYFAEGDMGQPCLRVKALANHQEKQLLTDFKSALQRFDPDHTRLCAHNGKEFDFPYLSRRMLVNSISLPGLLNLTGKKPWEVNHIDTMEMWKFGDRKHFTSLDLLARIFDIPSSKDKIDGSMVSQVYYEQNGLDQIQAYCAADVAVTAQVYLRLKAMPTIPQQNIITI